MSAQERLDRLTTLLYGLAAFIFAGTIVELFAAKHFSDPVQLVPFALCAVGLVLVMLAWKRPTRRIVQILRLDMALTATATLLGIWKHIEGNIGFAREMHPDVAGLPLVQAALTGRAPLLASGALAISATIALLATYAAEWELRGSLVDQAHRSPGQQAVTSRTSPQT